MVLGTMTYAQLLFYSEWHGPRFLTAFSEQQGFRLCLSLIQILQALLLFPLCFKYTYDYLSYALDSGGKKKISEPIWQYVEVGKGRCEFNLFLELKRFSDA